MILNKYSRLIFFFSLFITSIFFSCSEENNDELNVKKIFDEQNVDGCFILFNVNDNSTINYNCALCDSQFLPSSTFKIPHSLIALELGIIPDTSFTLKWDGKKKFLPVWNRDHNFSSALKNSVVWYYEEIGKRVGNERMQSWLDKINYGNKNVTGEYPYWLRGNLRITPSQQLDFMKKFYSGNLPFKSENIKTVKNVLEIEKTEDYKIIGKTGWGDSNGISAGWLIGYLTKNNNSYIFITLITSNSPPENFAASRLIITKRIFNYLEIIE